MRTVRFCVDMEDYNRSTASFRTDYNREKAIGIWAQVWIVQYEIVIFSEASKILFCASKVSPSGSSVAEGRALGGESPGVLVLRRRGLYGFRTSVFLIRRLTSLKRTCKFDSIGVEFQLLLLFCCCSCFVVVCRLRRKSKQPLPWRGAPQKALGAMAALLDCSNQISRN